ncbi:MAG TPA: glycerophosphodiester phosphodiesterase family protein [Dictyobacter sp.]|jgi:glycerophosphoryl diester phosphodiesterase|nr:glycerophosphodiester phosphodiesterase family protein [Dictyobacter sp.]
MKNRLQRVAHRGGSLLAPENTLAAFRNALTMPVDYIELDVQMSRDGHAIVLHDADVERVTDGTGNVLDLDFSYLRSLNAAAHFPGGWPQVEAIPTLAEVLTLAKGRIRTSIEIKLSERDDVYQRYPQIAETIVREVRVAGMADRTLIISFDWGILSHIHYLDPSLVTGALVSKELWSPENDPELTELCKKITAIGCNWINMDVNLFQPEMLPVIHQNGFKLGLWTINTLDELRFFSQLGVDSLTTDRPDFFSQL